ncbi:MAG: hypothetical protein J6Y37_01995 [Paludibacteraceae bacterium]|nr:hypothetical protein [Paludibacteraceae bacterium]
MYQVFKGNIAPEDGTIFVFGSNPEGRHGAGSAAVAVRYFGAQYGNGEGLQGNAYALPTTELRPDKQVKGYRQSIPAEQIIASIIKMYQTADSMPDKNFKVAYRSMPDEVTLCGYSGSQLMTMFREAAEKYGGYPSNVWFSEEWANAGIL